MSKLPSKGPAPTKIIVIFNDSSCLELNQLGLLTAVFRLPFRFTVPLPVKHDVSLGISEATWLSLETGGLEIVDLDGVEVAAAARLGTNYAGLSAHDCFSLILATKYKNPILLTSDRLLRQVCERHYQAEVRGVLWIVGELSRRGL